MKKFKLVFLLLITSIILTGCFSYSSIDENDDWEVEATAYYLFEYPDDWIELDFIDDDNDLEISTVGDNEDFTQAFVVKYDTGDDTISSDEWEEKADELDEEYDNYQDDSHRIDGNYAYKIFPREYEKGEQEYTSLKYYIYEDNRIHKIKYLYDDEELDEDLGNRIINSFEFRD